MEFDELSNRVIGCALEVHRNLGPGLLESAYEHCLAHELHLNQIPFRRQYPLPVLYKGLHLDCGYRLDLFVDDSLIVEIKSVERMLPLFDAQLLTYLRIAKKPVGLLINFNVKYLKDGLKRVVWHY